MRLQSPIESIFGRCKVQQKHVGWDECWNREGSRTSRYRTCIASSETRRTVTSPPGKQTTLFQHPSSVQMMLNRWIVHKCMNRYSNIHLMSITFEMLLSHRHSFNQDCCFFLAFFKWYWINAKMKEEFLIKGLGFFERFWWLVDSTLSSNTSFQCLFDVHITFRKKNIAELNW